MFDYNTQFGSFGNGNPYGQYGYQPRAQMVPSTPMNAYNVQPQGQSVSQTSNKIYVTGIDDAMNRYAQPNSNMVYTSQDDKQIYEISTDGQGRKTAKTFDLQTPIANAPTEEKVEYITRKEFTDLVTEVKGLKTKLVKTKKQEREVDDYE